jgi:hypothetical protein
MAKHMKSPSLAVALLAPDLLPIAHLPRQIIIIEIMIIVLENLPDIAYSYLRNHYHDN